MPDSNRTSRWVILFLISLMYLITYMDRSNISVAAPAIAAEFGISKTAMGFVFSAFLWAYSIGQIPGGWLADRFGARIVLLTIVPFWSVMTAMTAMATGAASLVVVRFVFGLGEAGAFPTATRAMQLWFPKTERGLVQGVTHSFSRFAIAMVPFVAVRIMLAWGWRSVFYLFGLAGLAWSVAFYFIYRDPPGDPRATPPWKAIFSAPNMWYIALAYGCFFYGTYFYTTWFPSYLLEYRHLSLEEVGIFASLPLVAGMVGDLVGGALTDAVYRKSGRLRFSRRIVAAPAMLGSAALLIPAATTVHASTAILCLTGSLFFLELVIGPAWAVPMDVGGQYSGTVTGVMNTAGSLAASASPIIFGVLVQKGSWAAPFFITAGVLVVGATIWTFLIDPERSVVEDAVVAV